MIKLIKYLSIDTSHFESSKTQKVREIGWCIFSTCLGIVTTNLLRKWYAWLCKYLNLVELLSKVLEDREHFKKNKLNIIRVFSAKRHLE